jgi:ABC-type amino acid transport substrate-binding protein
MIRLLQAVAFILLVSSQAAPQPPALIIGAASGFPPYQFAVDGQPAGFDVDVAKAIAGRLGVEARFVQGEWDNVVSMLRFGRIDVIVGMEVNAFRRGYFDFSAPYAKRHDAVFVLANSPASSVEDLFGQVVTGDRHSFVELLWREQGIHRKIRVTQTPTKEEAMRLLAEGKTVAAIMPLGVGRYLAREAGVDVRVLLNPDPGSEVAIALRKGQARQLAEMNAALRDIRDNGELDAIVRKWFGSPAGD